MGIRSFHIEELVPATADYIGPTWVLKDYEAGSMQVNWTGLTSLTSTLQIEISNDDIKYEQSGCGDPVILDVVNGTQIWEFRGFTTRYARMKYVSNGQTSGTLLFRSNEVARGR